MPKLWLPGPTEVRAEILAEMARPLIGHRTSEMAELIASLDAGLARAFGLWADSTAHVGVGTHSATAMMEAALHGAGERVLAVVEGSFAARWAEVARVLGKDVTVLEVEGGRIVDDGRLADALDKEGPFDALTLVANESSTGVHTPIQHVSNVLQAFPDTLLLVDVVSLLGGAPVGFDDHCVGFAFACVSKALALPPGITVFCASEDYLERAESRPRPSWYLDPVRALRGHAERHPPATPSIPHYRALARQLADIEKEGWEQRFARHARLRERTSAWAAARGFEPYPDAAALSPTVACLRAGALDVARFLADLRARGFEVANGYGPLKDRTFRIGHFGDHAEADLEELLRAADAVLDDAR